VVFRRGRWFGRGLKSMPLSSSDRLWQNKGQALQGVGGDAVSNMEEE
jgi:hypothetical protein